MNQRGKTCLIWICRVVWYYRVIKALFKWEIADSRPVIQLLDLEKNKNIQTFQGFYNE